MLPMQYGAAQPKVQLCRRKLRVTRSGSYDNIFSRMPTFSGPLIFLGHSYDDPRSPSTSSCATNSYWWPSSSFFLPFRFSRLNYGNSIEKFVPNCILRSCCDACCIVFKITSCCRGDTPSWHFLVSQARLR